jgi:probable HAF family extracellular repeat protein
VAVSLGFVISCGGGGDAPPAAPTTFQAVNLAQLAPGSTFSAAAAINGTGKVVGTSEDATGNIKGALWTINPGTATASAAIALAPLAGNNTSAASDINTGGTVVGQSQSGANTVPVTWTVNPTTGAVTAGPTALGTFAAGTSGAAYAVTDTGLIVGELQITAGGASHAVLWRPGVAAPVDLGSLAGNSAAYSITSQGVVVGESDNPAGATVAVFWTINPTTGAITAGPTALAKLNADDAGSVALGINSSGVIVGEAELASGATHAVRWASPAAASVVTDMGNLGFNSSAAAINTAGNIAAWNSDAGGPAVARYAAGGANPKTFTRLLEDNATFSQAYDINDQGTVVGIFGSRALAIIPR